MNAQLFLAPDHAVTIDGPLELERRLKALVAGPQAAPIIVELVIQTGAGLDIGLGSTLSVLSTMPPSLDPPYFISVSADPAIDETEIGYPFGGEWSYFSSRNQIPTPIAIRAACSFLETGTPPAFVRWEEV